MPLKKRDAVVAGKVAREAERFAGLMRRIPRDEAAPPHPEIGAMLRSFERINATLGTGTRAGLVTLRQKFSIGREFEKMGAALRGRSRTKA